MDEYELDIDDIIFKVAQFLKINPKEIEDWQLSDVLKYHSIQIEENEVQYYQYKKSTSGNK